MRAAIAVLLVGGALVGCGTWESQERARTVAAEVMECPGVTVEPRGDERFHATGCGEEIDLACTSGGNEPRCERVRIRTAGAEAETVAESVTVTEIPVATPEPYGTGTAAPVVPAGDPAAEAALRASIDARRDDVLACAGSERVVVRVRTDANGAARITLGGALAGGAEEGCVRAALSDLTAPPSIEVIHLVRAAAE